MPLFDPPLENDVLDSLRSIGDWYTIGLRLDLSTLVLDEIKENRGIREQKREMIRKWLQVTNEPSWKHILGILDGLGLTRPAQVIRDRYGALNTINIELILTVPVAPTTGYYYLWSVADT